MRSKIYNKEKKVSDLLVKQNNRCFYCNCKFEERNWKNPTLDHYIPYCQVWNKTKFVLACHRCNRLKGNISPELYEEWYICVNFKPWYDLESENKPVKVRNKINWFQKTFPSLFWWNKKRYKLTIKLYD